MTNIAFITYLFFTVSWFLHLTARFPVLGAIRFDLLIVVVLFLMKFFKGREAVTANQIKDDCSRRLNILIVTILLITPFAEWPGSVLSRGIPNFVKAVVFFYFTVWFVNSQKKLFIFLATFVGCQIFRFMEPLYLHVTEGYWGSKASMAGWEYMDRLAGAPSDVINPNGLAFVVITVLPFLICCYKVNTYFKIITFMVVPPALYVLMLTGSRSGYLAVMLMGIILFYKSKNKLISMIGAMITLFAVLGSVSDVQLDRFRSIYDSDTRNAATSEGRLNGWSKDFNVVLRRPIFGHGLGTSLEANANFRGHAQPAHNIYIEVLQELGVLGLVMFLMYLWSIRKSFMISEEMAGVNENKMLTSVKSAFSVLAITTLFFGFASYGLSSYEWYLIGGCMVVITRLLFHQINTEVNFLS